MPPRRSIRLLLVDDEPVVRRGLRMWLDLEPDLTVVGEVGNAAEAVALIGQARPDVVLMDLEPLGCDRNAATAELRAAAPDVAVVLLSLYDDAATRSQARDAGAAALIPKHEMAPLLLSTIRRLASEGPGSPPPGRSEDTPSG